MSRKARMGAGLAACALMLAACAATTSAPSAPAAPSMVHPETWPAGQSGVSRDAAVEAEVARLLALMSTEEKVGQVIQGDVNSVTPEDVRRYRLGSILNGGNSGPGGDDRAPAAVWLDYADRFYDASMAAPEGRPAIPIIWGSDAVHGNSNIIGATVFPHNIGLGATRNLDLMRRIGEITALELRVIGGDWTFAPTVAVVRDDRWGRTYEGYAEEPEIVRAFAAAMVQGIQGAPGDADFLRGPHVIATAKHFLGDGGTVGGADQGDNVYSEDELRALFAPAYYAAVSQGVQTVMASYNSWHGEKMHGYDALLSDVLIGRIGLDGFVVGDWNGHGQVAGCTPTSCAASFNAGLDMFMAPESWRELYDATLAQVQSGEIPMARLDEAVSRILRVKIRAGLFEAGRPSSRPYAGDWHLLGAAEHRAVARQAVRESLVLLKNEDAILPLAANRRVLVAGDGADDIGKQSGGWTISWQGTGNTRADFPNGQSIFEGIRDHVRAAGGTATLSVDGSFTRRPDVAIVVFGENPYAEFQGDIENLDYQPDNARDLALIQRLRAQGIPVISVFLSGRPMYVTPEINASNAFVAAWLPGSEGAGVADVLFRPRTGAPAYDFRGRLSFSWPRAPDQTPLNVGDANYDPLFAFGYGLTYAAPQNLGQLTEAAANVGASASTTSYLVAGAPPAPWRVSTAHATTSASDSALRVTFPGTAGARFAIMADDTVSLARQTNGDMALALTLRIEEAPTAPVRLSMRCGEGCRGGVDVTNLLRAAASAGQTTIAVRLSCLRDAGANVAGIDAPLELSTDGRLALVLETVRIAPGEGAPSCPS